MHSQHEGGDHHFIPSPLFFTKRHQTKGSLYWLVSHWVLLHVFGILDRVLQLHDRIFLYFLGGDLWFVRSCCLWVCDHWVSSYHSQVPQVYRALVHLFLLIQELWAFPEIQGETKALVLKSNLRTSLFLVHFISLDYSSVPDPLRKRHWKDWRKISWVLLRTPEGSYWRGLWNPLGCTVWLSLHMKEIRIVDFLCWDLLKIMLNPNYN